MLGIDERALRIIWTTFLFALLLLIVYFIRDTLVIFALAVFMAYMLFPIVSLIERVMPRRRNIALTIVYCTFIGLLVLIGFELVPEIASEAGNLTTQIPKLTAADTIANVPLPSILGPFRGQIVTLMNSQLTSLRAHVLPLIQSAGAHIVSGIGALLPVILIPILAFFFLKDAESIRVNLIGAVESGRDRTLMEQIIDDIHVVLKSYIRALVLLAVAGFTGWVVFLSVLGYRYPLLLAGAAGIGEFIPVIGPAAALVVLVVVCVLTGSKGLILLIVFWGVYRVFADYVLNPYLMSAGIELHPLLVLFAVLAGDSIAGTYLLQDEDGQIQEAHSISAGLDYPGIGPEHSWLHEIGRVEYVAATDTEALDAFQLCTRTEGIIPALEPAHALAHVQKLAPALGKDGLIVMNLCGRGDKDIFTVAERLGVQL